MTALQAAGVAAGRFEPLMTLYLTDHMVPDEIRRARDSGFVHGVKLYPAGATTNSDSGVTDLLGHCRKALEAMQDCGMPLLMHGEVTDPAVDVFDRESVFIERVLRPLRRDFPGLKVVFEHLTTADAVDYVRGAEGPIAATLTAHHLLYNRNALFRGGLRPHWYCLPILKREKHRKALLEAETINPTTVTSAAMDWGFWHLGEFAAANVKAIHLYDLDLEAATVEGRDAEFSRVHLA